MDTESGTFLLLVNDRNHISNIRDRVVKILTLKKKNVCSFCFGKYRVIEQYLHNRLRKSQSISLSVTLVKIHIRVTKIALNDMHDTEITLEIVLRFTTLFVIIVFFFRISSLASWITARYAGAMHANECTCCLIFLLYEAPMHLSIYYE